MAPIAYGYCPWLNTIVMVVVVGVVVQWLDYLAVTQEPGVLFPTAEEVASHVAPP